MSNLPDPSEPVRLEVESVVDAIDESEEETGGADSAIHPGDGQPAAPPPKDCEEKAGES
jgi:hypothetical protein